MNDRMVAVMEILPPGVPDGPYRAADSEPEVGHPRSAVMTAAMLSQYLVGRAIAARVSTVLLITGLGTLLGAAALWIWVSHVLAVLVGIVALCVLAFRAVLMRILRTLMGVGRFGEAEARVRGLVGETNADLRRELRRIGLPGSAFGVPLLIFRLLGRRRGATMVRLREFDVSNVVPKSRMDELNFVVRNDVLGR